MRLTTTHILAVFGLTGCLTEINDSDTQAQIDALTSRLDAVEAENFSLKERLADIESDYLVSSDLDGYATMIWVEGNYSFGGIPQVLTDFAGYLQVDTSLNEVSLVGVNVYIQSGSGYTSDGDKLLGLGNLIVGYDEDDGGDHKTGSHNLIIGEYHSYTHYGSVIGGSNNSMYADGSVVFGTDNNVSGPFCSILGGHENTISSTAEYATVSGGTAGLVSGYGGSISGGNGNIASGREASVLGGGKNTASEQYSTIAGGEYNLSSERTSHICGGNWNIADGGGSVVVGGAYNTALGGSSSILGGHHNTTSGTYSTAYGGQYQNAEGNQSYKPL